MDPFVRVPEYPFVICKSCMFACIAEEAIGHLRERHASIHPQERKRIAEKVQAIPGIIQDQAGLSTFRFPAPTVDPIPFIAPPVSDGLRCEDEACQYVTRTARGMQEHCRKKHGWRNEWKRGGDIAQRARRAREVPWTTGVRCQRFFKSRAASGWFEIGRASEPAAAAAEDPVERIKRFHESQVQRFETKREEAVRVANDKTEANDWVNWVGWARHLTGLDPPTLRKTMDPVRDDEPVLQQICESLDRVMDRARATATQTKVGSPALFEIQRKEVQTKPLRPFDNRMEEDSWARYKDVWRRLFRILFRVGDFEESDAPPYRLTTRQEKAFDVLEEAVEEKVEGASNQATSDQVDRLCLDLVMALLDHPFKQGHYDNAIISGLAIMGLREDGGWVSVLDYTPIYSAVIKVARMMVVYRSYLEREDEVAELMRAGRDEEDAREEATAIFSVVRAKVQRFMTRTAGNPDALPTPMDWIYEARTYGMHIRFNTTADGTIDWVGERIQHRQIKFTMKALSQMLHVLVEEARDWLAQLTAVEKEGVRGLPTIEWSRLEDDHSEDRVGYSFLHDERNTWLEKGSDWMLRRIAGSKERQKEWCSEASSDSPYRPAAVRQYGHAVEQFRERLWMVMHTVAGQPARSTEILGIRMVNTVNGGVRNIMAHNQMMCFVTTYHKNFRSTGQAKVIHRYLPREIGELLVWYLWLALPFWQQVQGIVKDADNRSPFLWSDEVVSRAEEEDTERRERERDEEEQGRAVRGQEEASDVPDTAEFRDWIRERKWTGDRARRIMQRHGERLMGAKLTVSAWRHIAIAISNRFFKEGFHEEGFGENDEGEDDIGDNPYDLQAGHGTHVAGMIYARELQQGNFGTADRREQFRTISRQWHRFLGFGAEDSNGAGPGKRRRDPFDSVREEARFQRFARLNRVDIRGKLRTMMGEKAAFRGQQEKVIRVIIRGKSPIVQITGTGGGKSLSFMLPAFCAAEGTTIVIVPLVSLREDLHRRCEESGIETDVWDSRGSTQMATIVFVTPESAVTKGFRDFVNRLHTHQALDRVVVDECHVLLDGSKKFRPQLAGLGGVIREWGVQTVFLTATLPPADEAAFFRVTGISARQVRMFRSRTTRKNIAYRVATVGAAPDKQEEEEDKKVCQTVRQWLNQHTTGRAIVYASSIERVERLADSLGCDQFHAKVDTAEGKRKWLKGWIQGGGSW